jgi:hypothetical protein
MNDHITAAEYREMINSKGPSKYRAKKTEVDGQIFDSLKEANHYCQLKLEKQQGEIIDFFRQVPFLVHEGYYKDGEWVKPIWYVADFLVIIPIKTRDCDGDYFTSGIKFEIHETKGKWTREALNKRKMFEKRYPEYEFIVI